MSITQARMIQLLNAAIDFRQVYIKLATKSDLLYEESLATQSPEQLREIIHQLYTSFGLHIFLDYAGSEATILTEFNHFKRNVRKNEQTMHRQRARRRQLGIKPRKPTDSPIHQLRGRIKPLGVEDGRDVEQVRPLGISQNHHEEGGMSEARRREIMEQADRDGAQLDPETFKLEEDDGTIPNEGENNV